jgi:hypothetical protein
MRISNPIVLAYLLLMAAYLAVSVAMLLVALLLATWPRARRTARRLAAGVVGSFPFAVFFQGLCLPILTALWIIPSVLYIWASPALTVMIAWCEFGLMGTIFLAATVSGAVTGYGVGARVADGVPMQLALGESRMLSSLAAGLSRFLPISRAVTPQGGIVAGLGIVILTVAGLAVARTAYVEVYGDAEIEYRGEQVRLSNKYVDYDDYKNDPDNLAPSEIARVEKMMTEVPIGSDFADRNEFIGQVSKMKFPGYGMWPGPKVVAAAREFVVEAIEIPQVAKDRYFVAEKTLDGSLRLVDDFVVAHKPSSAYAAISSIRLVDDRLVYADHDSNVVRETNVGPRP